MPSQAPHEARAVCLLRNELDTINTRLRLCGSSPVDASLVAELTTLRFASTRLTRRLRLLEAGADGPGLRSPDPVSRLRSELRDARGEAARRGTLMSLNMDEREALSDDRKVIDSLAALIEDGVEAGASYLSMDIRLRREGAAEAHFRESTSTVTLSTDAPLHDGSFAIVWLRALVRGRAQRGLPSVLRFENAGSTVELELELQHDVTHALDPILHEANRWASLSRI